MKKTTGSIIAILLAALLVFSFAACGNDANSSTSSKTVSGTQDEGTSLWKGATYTSDTELGSGAKTIQVEMKVEEKSITFTVHTDKETLGEALVEHKLVEGENGAYGLYVKTVNGILADYDIDQSYWAFSKNGESLMTGIDAVNIADGEHYEIIYTKN